VAPTNVPTILPDAFAIIVIDCVDPSESFSPTISTMKPSMKTSRKTIQHWNKKWLITRKVAYIGMSIVAESTDVTIQTNGNSLTSAKAASGLKTHGILMIPEIIEMTPTPSP